MTDLSRPSGYYVSEPRLNSNTAADFFAFVLELILGDVLVPGDYFVVDNAPVHFSEEFAPILDQLEAASGVRARSITIWPVCSLAASSDDVTVFFVHCFVAAGSARVSAVLFARA